MDAFIPIGAAEQLALCYAVGGCISANTRAGTWGSGAIDAIGEQLQKELPGLWGFTSRSLRLMRTFFEEWRSMFSEDGGQPDLELASAELKGGALPILNLRVPESSEGFARDFLCVKASWMHATSLAAAGISPSFFGAVFTHAD